MIKNIQKPEVGDIVVRCQSFQFVERIDEGKQLAYLFKESRPIAFENCIIACRAEHVNPAAIQHVKNERNRSWKRNADEKGGEV